MPQPNEKAREGGPTRRRRLVCVTNIPTPYRVHLFEVLASVLDERDIDFEAVFLASGAPHRYWDVDLSRAPFATRVDRGLHPYHGDAEFHVNPGTVVSMLKRPPSWLVLGGAWFIPTVATLATVGRLHRRGSRTIMWAEANPASRRFPSGAVAAVRRTVMTSVDAFAVPGAVAESAISASIGRHSKPFLRLPNIVDERAFGGEVSRLRRERSLLRAKHGLGDKDLVLLWPARLMERDKGILNFLQVAKDVLPPRARVLLAGEGEDRPTIEAWLLQHDLPSVRLLGHVPQTAMLELLAIADIFLLPSLADPNPVSVVEALWAGLPLLLSNRCGNWPEALDDEANGWLVDPNCRDSLARALDALFRQPPEALEAMGRRSRSIAQERFSSRNCVRNLAQQLELLAQPTRLV